MKKLLPKFYLNPRGFTLIELMVVMTIISILAVIGVVSYSSVSGRARDSKRIQEIDAIQKAMEKSYVAGTGYATLKTTDFANGAIPTDPLSGGGKKCGTGNNKDCAYCAYANNGGDCVVASGDVVSTTKPAAGTSYTVCANLENAVGAGGVSYYCKSNLQ